MMTAVAMAGMLAGCGEKSAKPVPAAPPAPAVVSSGGVTVTSVSLAKSDGHIHATIFAEIKNTGTQPLTAGPPDVRFRPSPDKSAAPFIAPGLEPAVIAPGATAAVATHWWFPASDLSSAARFEVGSTEIPVPIPPGS